jgi:hypothetical protein
MEAGASGCGNAYNNNNDDDNDNSGSGDAVVRIVVVSCVGGNSLNTFVDIKRLHVSCTMPKKNLVV